MFHSVELCCYVFVSLYVYSKYLITYCCQLLKNCATFDIDAAHTLLWTMNYCGVVPTTLFNVWCYKKIMTSSNKLVTMSPNLIDSRSLFKVACFYLPSSLPHRYFIIYTDWSRGWIGCLGTHHEFYNFIISIKTASTFNIRSADFQGACSQTPKLKHTEQDAECARGWHSNILCTPIFILGQDESQGTINKIVDGQKSNCFLAGWESTLHFQ